MRRAAELAPRDTFKASVNAEAAAASDVVNLCVPFGSQADTLAGLTAALRGLRGQSALFLIRPDGHIALRGTADRPDLLEQFCRRVTDRAAS